MDVGTRAVPLENISLRIAKRHSPGAKPAIVSVGAAQAIFRFVILTGFDAVQPLRPAPLTIILVYIFDPAESDGGVRRGARIFVEPAADVVSAAIRLAAENNVRSGVNDRIEFLVLLRQLVVHALQRR